MQPQVETLVLMRAYICARPRHERSSPFSLSKAHVFEGWSIASYLAKGLSSKRLA